MAEMILCQSCGGQQEKERPHHYIQCIEHLRDLLKRCGFAASEDITDTERAWLCQQKQDAAP